MLLIELAGLPGCGKSTLWEVLKSKLQQTGRNVYTYSELMRREPLFVNRGFLLGLQKWNPKTKSCMDRIGNYCASLPKDVKRERFQKEWEELYYREHAASWIRGEDIVLLDEGIVQNLTSLFFMDAIPREPSMDQVLKNMIHVRGSHLFVKCNISVEESMYRLKKRARENDRYYPLNEETLREALLVKEQNIDYCLSFVDPCNKISIDMENSAMSNADLIINTLNL